MSLEELYKRNGEPVYVREKEGHGVGRIPCDTRAAARALRT